MENYYKLLEIHSEATFGEVKKRCQQLFLKHHPDKQCSTSSSSSLFLKLQEARKILLDPDKRKDYDKRLKEKELESLYHPVFSEVVLDELEFDEDLSEYFMECRCGGIYRLCEGDIHGKSVISIPCDNCTFYLEVLPH